MTISQLQYLLAVAKHKNFSKASEECCISQPALSMQVILLEKELKTKIFDRSSNPVSVTPIGEELIKQANLALGALQRIKEVADEHRQNMQGEIRLGVIPTLAPYLLPLFLKSFQEQYPQIKLRIKELTTAKIIDEIGNMNLDMALLATPLLVPELKEIHLFYEKMFAYVSPDSAMYGSTFALAQEIKPEELWLLEEGHCFRSQIMKLCELKKQSDLFGIDFQAGSIETLIKLVDRYHGITIIPELATFEMDSLGMSKVRSFIEPVPMREISLIHHQNYQRTSLINSLKNCILDNLPKQLLNENESFNVIDVY